MGLPHAVGHIQSIRFPRSLEHVSNVFKNLSFMVQDPHSLRHKPRGWGLLHLAASLSQPASVKVLLQYKADVHGELYIHTVT